MIKKLTEELIFLDMYKRELDAVIAFCDPNNSGHI